MDKLITVKVESNLSGKTIEYVLEKYLLLSRTLVARLKRCDGAIILNDKAEKVISKVNTGDVLKISVPSKQAKDVESTKMELDILYEDDDIIAVNKPYGMVTHPVNEHICETLENGITYYLSGKKVHIITRLDRETSGIVLVAKNPVAAKFLTEEIKTAIYKKNILQWLKVYPIL